MNYFTAPDAGKQFGEFLSSEDKHIIVGIGWAANRADTVDMLKRVMHLYEDMAQFMGGNDVSKMQIVVSHLRSQEARFKGIGNMALVTALGDIQWKHKHALETWYLSHQTSPWINKEEKP